MARQKPAKRANRANPRADRNEHDLNDNVFEFSNKRRKGAPSNQQPRAPREEQLPPPSVPDLIPRNLAQEEYLDALNDETQYIVVAHGPAGCGKTWMAMMWAISQLEAGVFRRIVITKPVVASDNSNLGALPGGILEKLGPWFSPMIDVLKEVYGSKRVVKMIEDEIIIIQPLAMIRGRSFKDTVIVFDEAQSADSHVCRSVLTRMGMGSRIIMMGDVNQAERGFEHENGLKDFIARVEDKGSSNIEVCRFSNEDIERHPVISEVLELYGQ